MTYLKTWKLRSRKIIFEIQTTPYLIITTGFLIGILFSNNLITLICSIILFQLILRNKYFLFFTISLFIGVSYSINSLSSIEDNLNKLSNSANIEYFGRIIEPISSNSFSNSLVLSIEGHYINFQTNYSGKQELQFGDNVVFSGELKRINDQKISEGYLNYLNSRKIFGEVSNFKLIEVSRNDNINSIFQSLNTKLQEIINRNLNNPKSDLANGILLGTKANFDDDLKNNLRKTGTSHITSASGFNVAIIFVILSSLSGIFNIKKIRYIGIIGVFAYTLLIGLNILPAVRAAIMISYILIAKNIGRQANVWIALNTSLIIIAIWYPFYLLNISVLLSVFATLGLFLISPVISTRLKFLPKTINEIISGTFGATLATLPITLLFFDTTSLLSLLANLAVLPLIPFIMYLLLIGLTSGLLGQNFIVDIVFIIIDKLLDFFIFIINLFSQLQITETNNTIIRIGFFLILVITTLVADYINHKKDYANL